MTFSFLEFDKNIFVRLEDFASSTATNLEIIETVRSILDQVNTRKDEAVLEKTKLYDKASLLASDLLVSSEDLQLGFDSLTPNELVALESARQNISDFHHQSLPENWEGTNSHGAKYGEKYYPIKRVGLYVPGGSVPLVSTVLMTTTLAKVAKVPEIVVVTPPDSKGEISPKLLGAIKFSGVSEVYKVGGAQAIGALAYGTESIPKVDKIFGPGNAYVNEAKRQVFGTVGVDLLPGPSEVMIIADETANPKFTAAALLAQAEHGSGKEKVYFLFSDKNVFTETEMELKRQLSSLRHETSIRFVLDNGFMAVHTPTTEKMAEVANFIAPEHLELQVAQKNLDFLVDKITTAGALLLGHYSATALGDFIAGPSHVLPTGRSSRFSSGLRMQDFLRRSSFIHYDQAALLKAEPEITSFAQMENLDGHGMSVNLRALPSD